MLFCVWAVFYHLCFWVENGGGGLRNVKKLKKKRQKVQKSGEKRGKRRKIEKKVTKSAQNCTPDTKTSFNVKIGNLESGKISVSK